MPYPIILNGDHAEYEMENANVPLKERSDWPFSSFDANDWAEAFCKQHPDIDHGEMLAWFAGALMRGYDEHSARSQDDDGAPSGGSPLATKASPDRGPTSEPIHTRR